MIARLWANPFPKSTRNHRNLTKTVTGSRPSPRCTTWRQILVCGTVFNKTKTLFKISISSFLASKKRTVHTRKMLFKTKFSKIGKFWHWVPPLGGRGDHPETVDDIFSPPTDSRRWTAPWPAFGRPPLHRPAEGRPRSGPPKKPPHALFGRLRFSWPSTIQQRAQTQVFSVLFRVLFISSRVFWVSYSCFDLWFDLWRCFLCTLRLACEYSSKSIIIDKAGFFSWFLMVSTNRPRDFEFIFGTSPVTCRYPDGKVKGGGLWRFQDVCFWCCFDFIVKSTFQNII